MSFLSLSNINLSKKFPFSIEQSDKMRRISAFHVYLSIFLMFKNEGQVIMAIIKIISEIILHTHCLQKLTFTLNSDSPCWLTTDLRIN